MCRLPSCAEFMGHLLFLGGSLRGRSGASIEQQYERTCLRKVLALCYSAEHDSVSLFSSARFFSHLAATFWGGNGERSSTT